jgi:hypothetical protein
MHRRTSHRLLLALSTLFAAVAAIVIVPMSPAAAAPPNTPTPGAATAVETADYASTAWANPWDYSDAADLNTIPGAASNGVNNLAITGGHLSFDTTPGGYVYTVNDWGLVIPHDRDGPIKPINAAAYPRVSFRLYSSTASSAGLYWWPPSCGAGQGCFGFMSFGVQAGWNTYDMAITPNPGYAPWSGLIHELRLVPNGNVGSSHVEIDWMRLASAAPGGVAVSAGTSGADQVWWTTGGSATPAVTVNTGILGTNIGSGGSVVFPYGAYPPGAYRFFSVKAGETSALSSALTVSARPQPVVISPDVSTGDDWATVVRGNPWDMSSGTGDIPQSFNFNAAVGPTMVCGTGAGTLNDPEVYLAVPSPIDAAQFHRLSFTMFYDPPFGLGNSPGGGMVARVSWVANDPVTGQNARTSQDIVVYPGWQTISFDLKTNPLSAIEEEGMPDPIGWGGPRSSTITSLRIDPHEDPGGRKFCIDDVKLTRNDRGNPNYTIRFADNAWKAGEVADIFVSPNADGSGASQIGTGVGVVNGQNQFVWTNAGINTASSWYVKVVIRDALGTTGTAVSNGQVDMAPPPSNPFGWVDSANGTAGGVNVAGWAIDPQQGVNAPIQVQSFVDGVAGPTVTANGVRDDVAAVFPGHGNQLAFNFLVPAGPGTHSICLTGVNIGPGTNTSIGCRTVNVLSGSPFGSFDQVSVSGPGQISVSGWVIDPDLAGPTQAHVYVDGAGVALTANLSRSDIGSIYPGYGPGHGFSSLIPVAGGTHNVCVFGINLAAPGAHVGFGCRSIVVPSEPFGWFDSLTQVGPNTINVAGWAIDPDTSAPTDMHVYIDGVGYNIKANKSRPDLSFLGYGPLHSLNQTFTVPGGTHSVCVYGINTVGPGSNVFLGCMSVSMAYQPVGNLEGASRSGSNLIVSGWGLDPDNPNPTDVHIYVDGVGTIATASANRPDIGAAFPINGPNHGFSKSIAVSPGQHTVCAYVINTAGPGSNLALGCVTAG